MKQQVEAFTALQPNVKITNQLVFGAGEGYLDGMPYDKILTQIVAGTGPDVFMVGSLQALDFASKGGLKDADTAGQAGQDRADPDVHPHRNPDVHLQERRGGAAAAGAGRRPGVPLLLPRGVAGGGAEPEQAPEDVGRAGQLLAEADQSRGRARRVRARGAALPRTDVPGLGDAEQRQDPLGGRQEGALQHAGGLRHARVDAPLHDAAVRQLGQPAGVRQRGPGPDQPTARVPQYTDKVGIWITGVWHFFEAADEAAQYNPQFKYGVALVPANARNPQANRWRSPRRCGSTPSPPAPRRRTRPGSG